MCRRPWNRHNLLRFPPVALYQVVCAVICDSYWPAAGSAQARDSESWQTTSDFVHLKNGNCSDSVVRNIEHTSHILQVVVS